MCYVGLVTFSVINYFYALPVAFNTMAFSMLIIYAGSVRSVFEMFKNYKAIRITKTQDASSMETMSQKDAMYFPLTAGAMLCGLYALIKYFGKESVNYLLLAYMGFGVGTLIKDFLLGLQME